MLLIGPLVFSPVSSLQEQATQAKPCIQLNSADQKSLETLPGVGPVLAKRILAFRLRHKGFKRKEELLNVAGIGLKRFEKLKTLICLQSPARKKPPKTWERRLR